MIRTVTATMKAALIAYPVGSIYMSVNDVSPETLFGGTWERIKDKFLLSAGDTYTAGDTGGSATHTLTTAEMPAHTHTYDKANGTTGSTTIDFSNGYAKVSTSSSNHTIYTKEKQITTTAANYAASVTSIGSTSSNMVWATELGGSQAHTHTVSYTSTNSGSSGSGTAFSTMPPYLAVYMWKRTA